MRQHLVALRTKIIDAALVSKVWIVDVQDLPQYPYVLLSPSQRPGAGQVLCGTDVSSIFDVLLTSVADHPTDAIDLADAVKRLLAPEASPSRLTLPGRHVEVQWLRTEVVDVDRVVDLPGTNSHPAYRKDSYRIYSTPL